AIVPRIDQHDDRRAGRPAYDPLPLSSGMWRSPARLRTRRHDGSPRVSTGHHYVCRCRTWQAAAVVRCGASTERPIMRFRLRALVVPSLLFAAACSEDSPTTPDDPGASEEGQAIPPIAQRATGLGVSIVSSDASGAPRLIRAIVPRAMPAG